MFRSAPSICCWWQNLFWVLSLPDRDPSCCIAVGLEKIIVDKISRLWSLPELLYMAIFVPLEGVMVDLVQVTGKTPAAFVLVDIEVVTADWITVP